MFGLRFVALFAALSSTTIANIVPVINDPEFPIGENAVLYENLPLLIADAVNPLDNCTLIYECTDLSDNLNAGCSSKEARECCNYTDIFCKEYALNEYLESNVAESVYDEIATQTQYDEVDFDPSQIKLQFKALKSSLIKIRVAGDKVEQYVEAFGNSLSKILQNRYFSHIIDYKEIKTKIVKKSDDKHRKRNHFLMEVVDMTPGEVVDLTPGEDIDATVTDAWPSDTLVDDLVAEDEDIVSEDNIIIVTKLHRRHTSKLVQVLSDTCNASINICDSSLVDCYLGDEYCVQGNETKIITMYNPDNFNSDNGDVIAIVEVITYIIAATINEEKHEDRKKSVYDGQTIIQYDGQLAKLTTNTNTNLFMIEAELDAVVTTKPKIDFLYYLLNTQIYDGGFDEKQMKAYLIRIVEGASENDLCDIPSYVCDLNFPNHAIECGGVTCSYLVDSGAASVNSLLCRVNAWVCDPCYPKRYQYACQLENDPCEMTDGVDQVIDIKTSCDIEPYYNPVICSPGMPCFSNLNKPVLPYYNPADCPPGMLC